MALAPDTAVVLGMDEGLELAQGMAGVLESGMVLGMVAVLESVVAPGRLLRLCDNWHFHLGQ